MPRRPRPRRDARAAQLRPRWARGPGGGREAGFALPAREIMGHYYGCHPGYATMERRQLQTHGGASCHHTISMSLLFGNSGRNILATENHTNVCCRGSQTRQCLDAVQPQVTVFQLLQFQKQNKKKDELLGY